MIHRLFGFAGVAVLLAAAAVASTVGGCSSSTNAVAGDGGTDGAAPADGSLEASPDSGPECTGDGDACRTCCRTNHAAGAEVYTNAVLGCICGDGGPCVTACATTTCASSPTDGDEACNQCIDRDETASACESSIDATCKSSEDCTALLACADACPP